MARIYTGVYYTLDWRNNFLFGWEKRKSLAVVASLAEQILLGAKLPPVKVFQLNGHTFELSTPDGGHNRALAYCLLRTPLVCSFAEKRMESPMSVDITAINLVEDEKAIEYDRFGSRTRAYADYVEYSGAHPLVNSRIAGWIRLQR